MSDPKENCKCGNPSGGAPNGKPYLIDKKPACAPCFYREIGLMLKQRDHEQPTLGAIPVAVI